MKKRSRKKGKTLCSIQHNECLNAKIAVHVVEVPVKELGKPEVVEAKEAEMKNLEKPQSYSPTVLRTSMKTFVAVAANEGFEMFNGYNRSISTS